MKIKVHNNWEYLTYTWNGKELDEKKDGEVTLKNGDVVSYKSVKRHTTYNDMGHTYGADYYDLIATIQFNEQEIKVKLSELDIQSIPAKYFKEKKHA